MAGIRSFMDKLYENISNIPATEYPTAELIAAVEIMAQLERVYNYAHTGNTACIASSSMTTTWFGISSIVDGLPCLDNKFLRFRRNEDKRPIATFMFNRWPMHKDLATPHLASKASILYHIGPSLWTVSVPLRRVSSLLAWAFPSPQRKTP